MGAALQVVNSSTAAAKSIRIEEAISESGELYIGCAIEEVVFLEVFWSD